MSEDSERQQRFLERLAMTSDVTKAVQHAGWTKTGVQQLKRTDKAFRAAWVEALAIGYEELEMEMLQRARKGIRKVLTTPNGEKPATVTEFNDAQGFRLLMAHKQEIAANKPAQVSQDIVSARQRLIERLEALRECAEEA